MVCILAKDPVTAKSPAYHDHLLHRILLNLLNATLRPLTHSIFAASNTSSAMNADPLAFLQRERRQRSKAVGVPVTSTEHRFLAARSRAAMVGRERLHLLRNRRFADSPLEGGGFEPSVPRRRQSPPWPLNLLQQLNFPGVVCSERCRGPQKNSDRIGGFEKGEFERNSARRSGRVPVRAECRHTKSALRRSTRTSRFRFKEGPETCRGNGLS